MIEIFNESKEKLEFESYESLFGYIKKQIKDQNPFEEGQEDWNFVVHPSERLSAVYHSAIKAIEILLSPKEQEAYENGLNLLEMYRGDSDTPTQIVLTNDINVHEMKKSWCRDYCLEHGYTMSEREFRTVH
jgi:hypothetical protein